MKRTNYHLVIKENNQSYYFHNEYIATGDIIRIGGYRTVVISKVFDGPYIELIAHLINEGETTVTKEDLR